MSEKRLTGRIARENIRLMQVPRPPQGVIEGFRALGDATGIVSDVMDELGIPCGVVGAHILRPTIPGSCIVGPALTVRNVLQRIDPLEGARNKVNRMAEFEAHNLATPGDVLVIDAVTGKWRLQTIEINGPVQIGGVRVEPGDLVVADETSVCFVPRDRMTDVLA